MIQKRALMVVLVSALLGAFLVAPAKVAAASYVVNFDGGYTAYTPTFGEVRGPGYNSANALYSTVNPDTNKQATDIEITFASDHTLDGRISFALYGSNNNPFAQPWVYIYNSAGTILASSKVDRALSTGWYELQTANGFNQPGVRKIRIVFDNGYNWVVSAVDNINIPVAGFVGPEYMSVPDNEETIDFGTFPVNTSVTIEDALQIWNVGDDDTTLNITALDVTGDGAGSFAINTSPPFALEQDEHVDVSISCIVRDVGAAVATLTVTSDDSDEGSVTYTLTCIGEVAWTYPFRDVDRRDGYSGIQSADAPFSGLADATDFAADKSVNAAFAETADAPVFAVHDGEVLAVQPVEPSCENQGVNPMSIGGTCLLPNISIPDYERPYLRFEGAYYIDVEHADARVVTYVVANPRVSAGDIIVAGCQVGTALPVSIRFGGANIGPWGGYTLLQGRNADHFQAFDLAMYIGTEPTGVACSFVAYDGQCEMVGNAAFEGTGHWSFERDTQDYYPRLDFDGTGLVPTGITRQTLSLDAGKQYSIVVVSRPRQMPERVSVNALYSFTVQLGSDEPHVISGFGSTPYDLMTIPAQYYSATSGTLFDLTIAGQQAAEQSIIDFICVYDANESPPLPAGGCIVLDPEFEASPAQSPWELGADPPASLAIPGIAVVPKDSWIRQTVRLNPKDGGGGQEYTIAATYRRQGMPQTGQSIGLAWAFSTFNGTFADSAEPTWVTDGDNITVAAATAATLTITTTGTLGNAAQIDRICITTTDGNTPPGYKPPPWPTPTCKTCAYRPLGDLTTDFSEYVGWLNCKFFQLWECQFKSLLEAIVKGLTNILTMLGYLRLWIAAVISNAILWSNANTIIFARWLNGMLLNMGTQFENALTRAITITYVTEGGAGFWDALVSLFNAVRELGTTIVNGIAPLLQRIIDGLFGVVGDLLRFLGSIFSLLVSFVGAQLSLLVGTLVNTLSALVNAFNRAAMAMPPGAFACDAPGTTLYYPCLGFYVLDNTIFAGPAMYVFPIFMGVVAIRLLLWGVGRIKRAFAWYS